MAELSPSARLTYMGLWCLADDGGYFELNVAEIGGQLYVHEPKRARERRVLEAIAKLVELGRVELLPCSEHALIPKLPEYRYNAGSLIFTTQRKHEACGPVTLPLGLEIPASARARDKSLSLSSSESVSESDSSSSAQPRGKSNGSKDPDEERREAIARARKIYDDPSQTPDMKRAAEFALIRAGAL